MEFTDLGICVSAHLNWEKHILNCIKKANIRLGYVKRTLGYNVNENVKQCCYVSLVRPLVEYCTQLWNPYNKNLILKLESLQRNATKYIVNDYNMTYTERLEKCHL